MASVITIAGEQLFAAKAQANEQLDIDTFIFANVPNQDPNAPINREEGIPTAHIVYQQNVQQVGRINDNVVVYSTVLDSITGPFEFNWVGLYSSVNQTLVAINHVPTVTKTATAPGAAGNTLNRNFGIEYSGIAELTGINVKPETWQLDFTARLSGMDLLTQQLAADMNGKDWFIDDFFKVVPTNAANTFSVTPGVGYVSGLRVELKQEQILIIQNYPQFVYVDAWFSGNANSAWTPQLAFTVTSDEIDDYVDQSGYKHYVFKIALIVADGVVNDLRVKPESLKRKDAAPIYDHNFKHIADLKNGIDASGKIVDFSELVDCKVFWRGYYAESDGGSNWGIVKQGVPPYADDGGSIFVINNNYYIKANLKGKRVNVKKFGARFDNQNEDTVSNNNCITFCKSSKQTVALCEGVSINGTLIVYKDTAIVGEGKSKTWLKVKNNHNADLILGENAYLLWDSNSSEGADNLVLKDFSIDGNRETEDNESGNISGSGIAWYGCNNTFEDLEIYHCATHGMRTEFGDAPSLAIGLEGRFRKITVGWSGEEGWRFAGPHDSHIDDVVVHTSGQKQDRTFKGVWFEKGNARVARLHSYSLFPANRVTHALYISRASSGNEFSQCHFEGAVDNVYIGSSNNIFDETNRIYYPWGGANVVLAGESNVVKAFLGEEYKGIGLPLAKGVVMDSTYGGPSNCTIEVTGTGQSGGWVDFSGSGGYNRVKVRGYNVEGVAYVGEPHDTDDVDISVHGPSLTTLKQSMSMTLLPVQFVEALGATIADAARFGHHSYTIVIDDGEPGAGIKLPEPWKAKKGAIYTVANSTANTYNIYPNEGSDILGFGINNPLTLTGLKTVQFTLVDEVNGKFIVLKGA
ncbi:hypothetical protein B4O99_14455 [Shewanella xiamenensis]|uniref:phage tail-collar fiber domain-containing protein n=1 Tax=Shewanella xiamenensis TaxID=332186 RepID=UPI001C4F3B9C|nr:phage tail protein [Shewanella xiamenensis]MBW0280719.1 hypothetical protein [Shewanella xiamenensis]